ncbi:MAG: hypothetical protein ACMUJM_11590 [bacterium]
MGEKVTIKTNSGKTITGEEVERDTNFPKSLAEAGLRIVLGAATGGLSEIIMASPDKVTVRDENGKYWTGREQE